MILKVKNVIYKYIKGFTIVELLIMIAVLITIFGIVYVSYSGVGQRASYIKIQSDLKNVEDSIEYYASKHDGVYPITTANLKSNWKSIDVLTDDNCTNGTSQYNWVPGIENLPQSKQNTGSNAGVDGYPGCYLYASNGQEYVLSAWNMLSTPNTSTNMYKRLGFRPFQTSTSTQFYTCNEVVVGGLNGAYDISKDYYKHSFTISNIIDCDQTPPAGAE